LVANPPVGETVKSTTVGTWLPTISSGKVSVIVDELTKNVDD